VFISARGEMADDTMKIAIAFAVVDELFIVHLNHPSRQGVILVITYYIAGLTRSKVEVYN
jgi:hypothetical protein